MENKMIISTEITWLENTLSETVTCASGYKNDPDSITKIVCNTGAVEIIPNSPCVPKGMFL